VHHGAPVATLSNLRTEVGLRIRCRVFGRIVRPQGVLKLSGNLPRRCNRPSNFFLKPLGDMSLRTVHIAAGSYVILGLFFVTWPGLTVVEDPFPLVLGLPRPMAWIAAWVAGCALAFLLLDIVEQRYRDRTATESQGATGGQGPGNAGGQGGQK